MNTSSSAGSLTEIARISPETLPLHRGQTGVRLRAQCAPDFPEPSFRRGTLPGYAPPATPRHAWHPALQRRRQSRFSIPTEFPAPPDSLHSRWPAGRSAQLPPSDVWSPARRHVLHHVGSANIATSHVGHPGPVRLLVRPATALRDGATVP